MHDITYFWLFLIDFPFLGADIADILGHKDTKVISDDNLAALVRQIAVNCDVGGFFFNFFCLSSQETLVYLIFALMVHEYCQCVAFLFHFQTSSEILHKLNKITLQIRREIPSIILDIYVATAYQRENKDSDFKQICFEENELIDLNFTNKCNSPQRLWLEFWFVDSLPPWFYRGSSLSLRTPTPQTGWSDFVRSKDWRPRSLVAQINKTSATSWSRCLATAYCHH